MTTQTRSTTAPAEDEYRFVGHLKALLENPDRGQARAAMAHLRRGLGKPPGTVYEMDRYVLERLPEGAYPFDEERYYLVASLFAFWHQGKDRAESFVGGWYSERNIGRSLRTLVDKDPQNKESLEKSTEKRLQALLNSHREDLPDHLRRMVALLKAKDVPVNWAQLLHDLRYWEAETRSVQHAWSKGFWVQPGPESSPSGQGTQQ